ncbi:MAG: SDR family NAD(P)-dependent oxidoreductase [Oscillospiraceae bacterium]|nr:SDR family NAD(P)-dependent oxidoreductase [Oscillospiraceae bacterium]
MDKYFEDKVAVVTGAAGTICSEVAKDLASTGMTVVLVGRTLEKLQKVEAQINAAGGKATAFACDVTDKASTEELAAKVIEKFGKCDYLVNGAGGNNSKAVPKIVAFDPRELEEDRPENIVGLYNVDMEAFEKVILTNTMGSVYPMLAFAKYMAKQGSGSIVNFASMNTYCPLTKNFAYAMSKAAVANFTQSFAAYFANAGIRINAVAPGFVVNERTKTVLGTPETGLTKRGQDVIDHTPTKKFGQAHDMCGCVRFLLDERMSSFVTGVTIPVDGGFLTLSGV